jgi:CheY-like chemotaxis protein
VTFILVVDDERAITDFVSEALGEEGHSVRVCHDGASALAAIHAHLPDLLLLDIGMPVMSGDQVLRELRAQNFSQLPVIVATAGTNAEQFLAQGATAILRKPFTLNDLLELVERCTVRLDGRAA